MELTLIVAGLAQRLDLSPVSANVPAPAGMVVNRQTGGTPIRVNPRREADTTAAPANDIPTIRDSWPGAAFSVRVASVEEGGTDREEGERVATEEHRILERGQGSSE